jgi:gliding motility-associated-like protein
MKAKFCFYKTGLIKFSKFFLALLFILQFSQKCFSQYWLQQGKGPTIDEALSIATDSAGNTYTTGYFTNTITFDTSNISSYGVNDIFIVKTNSVGIVQWVRHAGSTGVDKGLDIAADKNGNTVVTGYFSGTATFGSQTIISAGQQDIFIAKYNASGNLLWVQRAGGSANDVGNSIKFDNFGNVVLTGEFKSTNCMFGAIMLSAINNSIDVFTAKYDSGGNVIWAKKGSGRYTDRGTEITTDQSGSVYVAGQFSDTITFDVVHYNYTFNTLFLIKYDSSGSEQWFRWMGSGSVVSMNGLETDTAGNIISAGNYYSSINVFGIPTTITIAGTYTNNFFIAKFDTSGALIWTATNGENSTVNLKDIAITPDNKILAGGNFNCRFNDFADQYGQGVFCSVGYQDCFVASYDAFGNWIWARSYGGTDNDYLYGVASDNNGLVCTAGSFYNIYFPENDSNFIGYNVGVSPTTLPYHYCNDTTYISYANLNSIGNKDIYIGKPIDLYRQPLDYFKRIGSICIRDFVGVCIGNSANVCSDTVNFCGVGLLFALANMSTPSPSYNYLWNSGSTANIVFAPSTGNYSVTATSQDGCFSTSSSIYVNIKTPPSAPLITDSKGYNTNAADPTTAIQLCFNDSVTIIGSAQPGDSLDWFGFPAGQNPITVNQNGFFQCIAQSPNGCTVSTSVSVVVNPPLDTIVPNMICINDIDHNDTIEICKGDVFELYIYDTISNPSAALQCVPGLNHINWSVLSAYNSFYSGYSDCNQTPPYSKNSIGPDTTGWYYITASLHRDNGCQKDSFMLTISIYAIVDSLPLPTGGSLIISVTGDTIICPGDSAMLVATGFQNYHWNTGDVGDTIYVLLPGYYYASVTDTVTSPAGCHAVYSAFSPIYVTIATQPIVTKIPVNGIICPGDSIELNCDGTGHFAWYGPNGAFGADTSNVFVNTTGTYYCIRTFPTSCPLVSNTVDVIAYSTPFVTSSPTTAICDGQPVTLILYTDSTSFIQWLPPLSGNSFTQLITVSGTYHCTVTSCGITSPLSITIGIGNPVAAITTSGSTTICTGDSVQLTANSGTYTYIWQPFGQTSQSIYAAGAGQYILAAYDTFGCVAHDSITIYQITNPLTPPLTSDTAICFGNAITLTATGTPAINWFDSTLTLIASGSTYSTSQLFNSTIYYLQSDSGLCTSSFDTLNVTVDLNQSATITAQSPTTFCQGDSVQLVANAGMNNYLWQPNGQTSQSIYASVNGNYILYTYDSIGCQAIDSINIQVVQNTLIAPIANDTTICSGNSITLTATGSPIINWYNTTFTIITSGFSYTTPQLFSNTIYYLQTDSGVCKSAYDTVNIIVNLNNLLPPSINDTSVCSGNSITLTATGSPTINWFNNAFTQVASGYSFTTPLLFSPTIYYLQTDSGVCKSAFDSVSIMIHIIQPASITAAGSIIFCQGDSVQLTANAGMNNYIWQPFGQITQSIYASTNGNYILYTYDANGCQASDSIYVQVVANNLVPPLVNDTTICAGSFVTLTASGSPTINWFDNIFTLLTSGSSYTTPPLFNSIIYYVQTDSGLCKSSFDTVSVMVDINQSATITSSGSTTFCQGDSITLSANTGMHNYLWQPLGQITQSIYASISGIYVLYTYDAVGCEAKDSVSLQVIPNNLTAPLVNDTSICSGYSVALIASGSLTINWFDDKFNIVSTGNNFTTPLLFNNTIYYLQSDSGVCKSGFDSLIVNINECLDTLLIPNIFTPNGDGVNDVFPVAGNNIKLDIHIYNRWGNIVFESIGTLNSWKGNDNKGNSLSEATYFYIVIATLPNGTIKNYKGSVMLLR